MLLQTVNFTSYRLIRRTPRLTKKYRQRTDPFFQLVTPLKHVWFKLARVKLYLNDLKRNKNYFELAEGSSYLGFELPKVKLQ